jgi:glycosyltransferase involved in cell wall biosynthesis
VEFTGAVPNAEIPMHYQQARIAVVPSTVAADGDQEGLGLVAVEALGCGCATIVSGLPALEDVVEDEKTGLVFTVDDATDLARKILRLCKNEQLRLQLSKSGREYVANKFDWSYVGNHYLEIINRL